MSDLSSRYSRKHDALKCMMTPLSVSPSVPCVYLLYIPRPSSPLLPIYHPPLSHSLVHMRECNPHRGPYTLHPQHLSIRYHLIEIRIIVIVIVICIRKDIFLIRLIRVFPVAVFTLPFGDFGGYEGGGLGEVSVTLI